MDFDGDGWDDITLATEFGSEIHFYKNTNGVFDRVNFSGLLNTSHNKQVVWVDIDNDGDKDFYVANHGQSNRLYENLGNMSFQDITVSSGLDLVEESTFGTSFGDIDNDGFLDMFVMNRHLTGQRNSILYRNNGNKTFTNITISAQVEDIPVGPFCGTFLDYNKDGYLDFFIAEDKYYGNVLFENNGNLTFSDMSEPSGFQHPLDAMCVTPGDFDNDDDIDIYVTNTPLEGNHFFGNNGDFTFDTIEIQTNLVVHGFCWGSNFLDVENDGDLDLYISASYTPDSINSSHLFINNGIGSFNIANPIIPNDTMQSYSNAVGDYNRDGYPDIAVNNYAGTPSRLWKNTHAGGNWLKIKLEGTESNRDGFGSKLEVYSGGRKQLRYTYANEGFICQNADHEIFGLGNQATVDSVVVTWLSGIQDRLYNIEGNQELLIVEGGHPVGLDQLEYNTAYNVVSQLNSIEISSLHEQSKPVNITLFDLSGNSVYQQHVFVQQNEKIIIETDFIVPGIYLIQITDAQFKFTKKLYVL